MRFTDTIDIETHDERKSNEDGFSIDCITFTLTQKAHSPRHHEQHNCQMNNGEIGRIVKTDKKLMATTIRSCRTKLSDTSAHQNVQTDFYGAVDVSSL